MLEKQRNDSVIEYMKTLRKLMRLSVGWIDAIAEALGVSSTDLTAASYLLDAGPMTAGELGEVLGLSTGAMTTAIDRLERAGFAKREADAQDRRRVIIRPLKPNPKFHAMRESALKKIRTVFSHYSDAELLRMIDFTRDIVTAFEKEIPHFKKSLPKFEKKEKPRQTRKNL